MGFRDGQATRSWRRYRSARRFGLSRADALRWAGWGVWPESEGLDVDQLVRAARGALNGEKCWRLALREALRPFEDWSDGAS